MNALSDDSPTESHATPSKSRALQQYEESPTFGILQLVPVKTACRPCLNSFASPQGAVRRRCRPCRHHAAGLLALRLQGWPASSSKEAGGGLLGPGDGHLASVETLALSWQSDRPPLLPQNKYIISTFQSKPDRALLGPLPAHAKHAEGAAEGRALHTKHVLPFSPTASVGCGGLPALPRNPTALARLLQQRFARAVSLISGRFVSRVQRRSAVQRRLPSSSRNLQRRRQVERRSGQ